MRNFENSSGNGNYANSNRQSEQTPNREQLRLAHHQKKLVGYYLSGGDPNYIYKSDQDEYSEQHITENDKNLTLALINNYPKLCNRLEHQLLSNIESFPPNGKENNEILANMGNDQHQKRILNWAVGRKWDDYDSLSGQDMEQFLETYPTPIDFETDQKMFLQLIQRRNPADKYQEYLESMDDFCQTVYGRKYEYYKAIKGLHEEAAIMDKKRERRLGTQAINGTNEAPHIDRRALNQASNRNPQNANRPRIGEKLRSPEHLVIDAHASTLNKGRLIGDENRQNEDAAYYNPEHGLFAVFDGAGGERGAAQASGLAVEILQRISDTQTPRTALDLKKIAEKINDAVRDDDHAGYTTGVFGKIVEDEDGKRLAYASVGDSRIYIVRKQELILLTKDESKEGYKLYNALGQEEARVRQYGDYPLQKGDRIIFCTDGVTGDNKEQAIPDDVFVQIVNEAATAEDAARGLIRKAKKKDDRTAIVVEV